MSVSWSHVADFVTNPSGGENEGTLYIVQPTGSGDFAGQDNKYAFLGDARWQFYEAPDQARSHIAQLDCDAVYDSTAGTWGLCKGFRLEHGSALASLPAGWGTHIPFDTTVYTDSYMYTHGSGGTAGETTVNVAGWYRFVAHATVAVITTIVGGDIAFSVDTGGGFAALVPQYQSSSGMMYATYVTNATCHVVYESNMAPGDKIRVEYEKTPGASAGTGGLVADGMWIEGQFIGKWPN